MPFIGQTFNAGQFPMLKSSMSPVAAEREIFDQPLKNDLTVNFVSI
jgi:hypothetical protein